MSKPDTWMPLYIGDYLRDTSRLTTEQHGAYLLLIMDYWANGPLPDDDFALAQVTRLHPAAWKKNRASIARMFVVVDGVWRHKRIDEELDEARRFIEKQKANGAKGGRPKKTQTTTQDETQKKPMGFDRDTPNDNPNESPSPSPIPVNPSTYKSAYTDSNGVSPAGAVCARLKADGILDCNPQHPRLLASLDAGLSVEEIASIGPEAKKKGKGFAWVLATAEGRRRDAAAVASLPGLPKAPWFMTSTGIEEKAKELGIAQRAGEQFPYFKARVYEAAGITDEMVRKAKIDAGERT